MSPTNRIPASSRIFGMFLLCHLWPITPPTPLNGQQLADTLFQWQSYSSMGLVRIRIFASADRTDRTHVVILQEMASNKGPAVHEDLGYLVEEIGRTYGLDPTRAYWVLHWGAFSFPNTEPGGSKEIFLRATFRRTSDDRLGAPQWRVIGREYIEELTDRLLR